MSESETKGQSQEQKTSKLAIWSMVFGVVGFLSILGLFSQFFQLMSVFWCGSGLVLGVIALWKIAQSRGLLTGQSYAVAGVVISVLDLFLFTWIFSINYMPLFRQAQIVKINDVTTKTTLVLSIDNDPNTYYVDGISILITGHIDGSATIQIRNGGTKYPEEYIKKGMVCLRIYGDWYTNKCYLEYVPSDVHSGHLTIRYYFYKIQKGELMNKER